jgi:hypothetical protein
MIGLGPSVNSERSRFSRKTGSAFKSDVTPILEMDIEIQLAETKEGSNQ